MRNITIGLLLLVIFSACEKELDFKYHQVESQLVIEGTVSTNGTTVKLSLTTPMNEPMDTVHLTDAEVTLTDLTEYKNYILSPNDSGMYVNDYKGTAGHEYSLKIIIDGKEYTSQCVMRDSVSDLTLSFQWIKMPYDHVAVLEVSFNESDNQSDCYWIRLYRNHEPYKWLLAKGNNATDGKIHEVTFTTRKDLEEEDEKDILRDGDIMTAKVTAVSKEMYDYIVSIESDSNGLRMFSGDFCLGYFLAAEESQASIVFHPDEIPGP